MSIHIIIDGYNLIRQSQTFSPLDREDLELGRNALVDTLADYKRLKGHKITVVFDGTHSPSFLQPRTQTRGIKIKFSRRGETADIVIKKMAAAEREKALVVSSDQEVTSYALSRGCATINSARFEEKIIMSAYTDGNGSQDDPDGGWTPTTKKKGPRKRLPKKKRKSRVKIRKL